VHPLKLDIIALVFFPAYQLNRPMIPEKNQDRWSRPRDNFPFQRWFYVKASHTNFQRSAISLIISGFISISMTFCLVI